MKTWDGNYVSLSLESDDVDCCAHQGACDDDVEDTVRRRYVAEQLDLLNFDDIRAELKEYGAWDASELADDSENRRRLLWVAACALRDEGDDDEEEDVELKCSVDIALIGDALRSDTGSYELARILREVAAQVEGYDLNSRTLRGTVWALRDVNGNRVGDWSVDVA